MNHMDLLLREVELKWLCERQWQHRIGISPRNYGVSSDAMCRAVLTGPPPQSDEYPLDVDDLMACRRAIEGAPLHLRSRMERIFEDYQKRVRSLHPKADRAWLKHKAKCPDRKHPSYKARCHCDGFPWSSFRPRPPLKYDKPYNGCYPPI